MTNHSINTLADTILPAPPDSRRQNEVEPSATDPWIGSARPDASHIQRAEGHTTHMLTADRTTGVAALLLRVSQRAQARFPTLPLQPRNRQLAPDRCRSPERAVRLKALWR